MQKTRGRRLRILIIAEAANPEWVSVPLVGWSLSNALRQVADAHIATHVRNRDALTRAGLTEGEDFTAIDSEAIDRPIWRLSKLLRMGKGKGWTMVTALRSLSYPYFEWKVWQRFGPSIRRGDFDLVHRITPLTPTANSLIAPKCRRAGVPFVMGPLNGGVPWPSGFDRERRNEREWLSYIRSVYKALPGRAGTLRAASAIVAGSRFTQSDIPRAYQPKTVYLPENAIDPAKFNSVSPQSPEGPLRGCFVGRLVPYKGPDMLLEAALPLLKDGRLNLDIVGDGPMRASLEDYVQAHDLSSSVTLHGWVEHGEVQKVLARAHLLTFPSVREFGGGVVLEAMALGVVPLIVDYAGPGELVDASVGFKVPIADRAGIVAAFRDALAGIAANRGRLPHLGAAGRQRVLDHFTWDAKARQILDVYDWVLGRRTDRPDFALTGSKRTSD